MVRLLLILAFVGCGSAATHPVAKDGGAIEASAIEASPATGEASADHAAASEAPATDGARDAPADTTSAGDTRAVDVAPEARDGALRAPNLASAVAVGRYHVCALLADGNVKCWGYNDYGELGLGDKIRHGDLASQMGDALPAVDLGTGRKALQITAGRYCTCAILDDHTLKCWGFALDDVPVDSPKRFRGDAPGEMGDALPVMDLGPGRTAKRVAAGNLQACAVRDDDTLRCFALGHSGGIDVALPAGRKVVALAGADRIAVLLDDGSVKLAYADPDPTAALQPVNLGIGRRARSVAGAISKGIAVALEGGGVVGSVTQRRPSLAAANLLALGLPEVEPPCGLRPDGSVTCWRAGPPSVWAEPTPNTEANDPQLTVKLGGPAIDLQGGGLVHVCALMADHTVRCWAPFNASTENSFLGAAFPDGDDPQGRWLPIDLGTHPAP